ncbi:hypothetical protein BJ875DRAFT_445006 [Amylocarpus encephaloides]|uniref:Mid2 domain-containing protein n=1 Tax=Amylocarpus encephaloides TaxID=45428 RepID=A0A9P7YAT0_9HELO|nr:hypothetical protein BJ875DRAFT_445006 [Amylocarpus encephaloides]
MICNRSIEASTHRYSLLLLTLSFFVEVVTGQSKKCYYPNGLEAVDDIACGTRGDNSVCCGKGFVCLSNALCMDNSTVVDGKIAGTLWRGSCTDRDWKSSICPESCINSTGPYAGNTASGQQLMKCDGMPNTYMCLNGQSGSDCSNPGNLFLIQGAAIPVTSLPLGTPTSTLVPVSTGPSGQVVVITTVAEATTAPLRTQTSIGLTYTLSSNKPPTATSSPHPTSKPEAGSYASRHSLEIGVGVGGSVALMAIGGLAMFYFLRRRQKGMELEEVYKGPIIPNRPGRPDVNSPFDHRVIGDLPPRLNTQSTVSPMNGPGEDPLILPSVQSPLPLTPVERIGTAFGDTPPARPGNNWL